VRALTVEDWVKEEGVPSVTGKTGGFSSGGSGGGKRWKNLLLQRTTVYKLMIVWLRGGEKVWCWGTSQKEKVFCSIDGGGKRRWVGGRPGCPGG